jgi:hypothetical protein
MSQTIKIIGLAIFTIIGIAWIIQRQVILKETQARNERILARAEARAKAMEILSTSAIELERVIELRKYTECKGDYECESLYPNTQKAIKEIEDNESQELERKSHAKEEKE